MKTKLTVHFAAAIFLLGAVCAPAFSQSRVVISQVYGGGGNTGSTYTNDFIELFNSGDTAQDLTGWSVQYASATSANGTAWFVTNLSGTLQPGHYYLVQELVGAGGTTPLPVPDAMGTIAMSATAGKVALLSNNRAITVACPATQVDLVGYGPTANCVEGTAAPVLTNSTADIRAGAGCTDGNTNNADFTAGAASPRNTSTAANACIALQAFSANPSLSLNEGNAGTTSFTFTVKLNIPATSAVTFNASTADGTATAPGDYTAVLNAPLSIGTGQQTATVTVLVNGDTSVEPDETFTLALSSIAGASPITATLSALGTIVNDDVAAVSLSFTPTTLPSASEGTAYSQTLTVTNGTTCTFSTSGSVPPGLALTYTGTTNTALLSGTPSFSGTFPFTVSANCSNGSTFQAYSMTVTFACETGAKTSTAIHNVQGTGATSPLVGQTVEVEGIVVGDFQLTTQLKGFYLQEPDATWDADPLTSEGVFIFDNGTGADVNVGDRVRVRGTIDEFASSGTILGDTANSSLTEIGALTSKLVCSTGNSFTRTTVTLPVSALGDLERYEGMAVQFTQQLTVTGNFSLGTFDQLDLAPSLLYVPTITPNQAAWPAQANLNLRSVIALDDASTLTNTNLYPTLFPQGGLSAANTLRDGALVNYDNSTHTHSPLIGVLDDRFGEYRLQPTAAVTFTTRTHGHPSRPSSLPLPAASARSAPMC